MKGIVSMISLKVNRGKANRSIPEPQGLPRGSQEKPLVPIGEATQEVGRFCPVLFCPVGLFLQRGLRHDRAFCLS